MLQQRSSAKAAATRYDKMADNVLVKAIRDEYPSHSLLTEEGGMIDGEPDWLWLVDSLDGTGNYANWNPMFCVCLALRHKGELVLGVIYAPAIDEFYVAQRGDGAFLDGSPVRVSGVSELGESYLFYCEGGERDRKRTGDLLARVYPEVVDIRKLGSAGLESAWVAAGRGEAYFTTSIEPWDVAAGALLVSEAGGRVSDLSGGPWNGRKADLLFSNGRTHGRLLDILGASDGSV